jgi:predicted DNA-binding transcriptional regulator AlpA
MTDPTRPVLLTKAQVCERLSLSARTLETMVQAGRFPPPVRLGKCVYWTERAVASWLARAFGAQEAWLPAE